MSDRLTQLQDAVDQLAQQFAACLFFLHTHHDMEQLHPIDPSLMGLDRIKDLNAKEEPNLNPLPPAEFKDAQRELAQDLVVKEQQIEVLISSLPGLDSSEHDQERYIKELEEELKAAEALRQEAAKEKDEMLAKLDRVIQNVRRA